MLEVAIGRDRNPKKFWVATRNFFESSLNHLVFHFLMIFAFFRYWSRPELIFQIFTQIFHRLKTLIDRLTTIGSLKFQNNPDPESNIFYPMGNE